MSPKKSEFTGADVGYSVTGLGDLPTPKTSPQEEYQTRVNAFVAINERMPTETERRNIMVQAGIIGKEDSSTAPGYSGRAANVHAAYKQGLIDEDTYRALLGASLTEDLYPRAPAGPQWKPGELGMEQTKMDIAKANLELAVQAAQTAREQWELDYQAGRDDADSRNGYNKAMLDLTAADNEFDRLKLASEETRAGASLAENQRQFGETMGFNREQATERTRQFEVQEQRAREILMHQKQEDEIARLFSIAKTTGYIPIALLKMNAPGYLDKFGGIGG